jgi:hypothetical protein
MEAADTVVEVMAADTVGEATLAAAAILEEVDSTVDLEEDISPATADLAGTADMDEDLVTVDMATDADSVMAVSADLVIRIMAMVDSDADSGMASGTDWDTA